MRLIDKVQSWFRSATLPSLALFSLCACDSSEEDSAAAPWGAGEETRDSPEATGSGGGAGRAPDANLGGAGGETGTPRDPASCEDLDCGQRRECVLELSVPSCECRPGFAGARCEDVDECALLDAPCGPHAVCENRPGSYSCRCEEGFLPEGESCVDIDECATAHEAPCASNASCENTLGGFACVCPPATFGDGRFCKLSPDCSPNACSGHGECVETREGRACLCELGFGGLDCEETCSALQLTGPLEALVRSAIGKSSGPILSSDVASMTTLVARGRGLSDLSGLECWPDLRRLDVSGNQLSNEDIEILRATPRLEELSLDCNPVTSLDALSRLPHLRSLSFSQVGPDCAPSLSDISPIGGLTKLESLSLRAQPLSDLSPLAQLSNLRVVDLSGIALDANELEHLRGCPSLSRLRCSDATIASLDFLEHAPHLRALDISGNELDSLEQLSHVPYLEELSAAGLGLAGVAFLEELPALRSIDLSSNVLLSLEPFSSLPELHTLNVRSNQITTIDPALSFTRLTTLFVDDNPLVCSEELWAEEAHHVSEMTGRGVQVGATCNSND